MKELTLNAVTFGHYPERLQRFVNQMLAQTWRDKLKVIIGHDGPASIEQREYMEGICKQYPDTFSYFETPERQHYPEKESGWGHYIRAQILGMVDTEWISFTNCDNTYSPLWVEKVLSNCQDSDILSFTIRHSYFHYQPFYISLNWCQIDLMQFICRTKMAQKAGFNHRDFSADGKFVEEFKNANLGYRHKHLNEILGDHN